MTDDDFITAIAALHGAGDEDDLCAPFLTVLPATGIAISTLGTPFGSETVCASDATSARLDEIQFDLGEGPCWEAMRTGRPVLEPDVQTATSEQWPMALMAMQETPIGAVFAFPMQIGTLKIGVVDLYHRDARPITNAVVQDAVSLTDAAARQVLHRALVRTGHASDGDDTSVGRYSRREVYQASGMLAAQTGVVAADALLLLRAYAYASGRPVRDLSADVVARTVDFTDRNDTAP